MKPQSLFLLYRKLYLCKIKNVCEMEEISLKNDLLKIGPITVHGYGLMIAIGVLSAYVMAEYRAKKKGLNPDRIFDLAIWCVAGGILGAKLLYLIVELRSIIENPKQLLHIMDGFVVYGGIIGGILSGYLFCRRKHLSFLEHFDLVMPSIALAQGFGRIGCLLAGCCYGRETESAFHIIFEHSEYAPNGVALIPTQIIMSGLNFLHFFLLIFVAKHVKAKGQVAAVYLMCYSVGRFFMEYLRNDPRGSVSLFSTSQFISLFILIAGIALFFLCAWWDKNKDTPKEIEKKDMENNDTENKSV